MSCLIISRSVRKRRTKYAQTFRCSFITTLLYGCIIVVIIIITYFILIVIKYLKFRSNHILLHQLQGCLIYKIMIKITSHLYTNIIILLLLLNDLNGPTPKLHNIIVFSLKFNNLQFIIINGFNSGQIKYLINTAALCAQLFN